MTRRRLQRTTSLSISRVLGTPAAIVQASRLWRAAAALRNADAAVIYWASVTRDATSDKVDAVACHICGLLAAVEYAPPNYYYTLAQRLCDIKDIALPFARNDVQRERVV